VARELPEDLFAERACLGCMLINRDTIRVVLSIVTAEHFAHEQHKTIFGAIKDLFLDETTVDIVTVGTCLGTDRIGFVGGYEYISSLLDGVPATMDPTEYALTVRRVGAARMLATEFARGYGKITSPRADGTEVASSAIKNIREIATQFNVDQGNHISSNLDGLSRIVDQAQVVGSAGGVELHQGLYTLKNKLFEFEKGKVHVVAGKPGSGKTAFALLNMLEQSRGRKGLSPTPPVSVFFVSIEMGIREVQKRLLSLISNVSFRTINQGNPPIKDLEKPILSDAYGVLEDLQLYIDPSPKIKTAQVVARIERAYRAGRCEIAYIDYIQLMRPDTPAYSRTIEVGAASQEIVGLAKSLDIPIVLLSQLNNKHESRSAKHYMLSDLKETGQIGQDASSVTFLELDHADPTASFAQIAKNRTGPLGTVDMFMHLDTMRWGHYEGAR